MHVWADDQDARTSPPHECGQQADGRHRIEAPRSCPTAADPRLPIVFAHCRPPTVKPASRAAALALALAVPVGQACASDEPDSTIPSGPYRLRGDFRDAVLIEKCAALEPASCRSRCRCTSATEFAHRPDRARAAADPGRTRAGGVRCRRIARGPRSRLGKLDSGSRESSWRMRRRACVAVQRQLPAMAASESMATSRASRRHAPALPVDAAPGQQDRIHRASGSSPAIR